jgi:GntP family gluconate:H+ symporter
MSEEIFKLAFYALMNASLIQILLFLLAGIALIVLLTAKFRIHAFFALILACFLVGLGVEMPMHQVITTVKDGFGNIMKSLGLIIVLGTTLGVILESTGSTRVMAAYILRKTGERYAAIGMSLTGFVVGLPIFCDSGFIVLYGLNKPLSRRTGIPLTLVSISLATGLYSVHCLIPPHPGAAAAAGAIGADIGKLILMGIAVAIPAMLVGYWWARFATRNEQSVKETEPEEENGAAHTKMSALNAFLPVAIPIILIAAGSFIKMEKESVGWLSSTLSVLGDPVMALSVGVILAFICGRKQAKKALGKLLSEGAEKAGGILIIIGAGGAFGAVLAAANLGQHLGNLSFLKHLGILFPFLLTFVLKTAQGSSTVAIITAASIVEPLLPVLGLESTNGKLLAVLSMGAGSMMISHANDAYFWVISKFSEIDMRSMLRVYSIATILMGLISFVMVFMISLIIL